MTSVGRALKSQKLTLRFIGSYQILKKVGEMTYKFALPQSLSNLHGAIHVSQFRKYIPDPSQVIHLDDGKIRENFTSAIFLCGLRIVK